MGYDQDVICNVKLNLSLGGTVDRPENLLQFAYRKESTPSLRSDKVLPSLTLSLSSELTSQASNVNHHCHEDQTQNMPPQPSSVSTVSSFFNGGVKREKEVSYEEMEGEKGLLPKVADDRDEDGGARKKLRLTKEQSVILEDCFRVHSTLNPTQKQELSERLNLRPRQVEVWFQNRRARIKLKKTEVDCEVLKRSCEKLTDENRRLRKELQELKVLKLPSPVYMQLPAAKLSLCPSCEKMSGAAAGDGDNPSRISFSIGTRPHIYNPFTKPSAAY